MSTYKVSSESLQSTAKSIADAGSRIETEIGAVQRQVEATREFWEGNAQGTYHALMEKWNKSAKAVHEALADTVQALNKAAEDYAITEGNQVTRFGGA